MLPPCSDNSGSTPLPLSHPTASVPLTKPTKHLLFRSPLPKGEGIKQALAWNREQLVDLRRLWELRRQRAPRSRAHSYDSSANDDLRRCARCGEQREYCHRHTPVIPNPSLDLPPNPPRITVSGSVLPNSMARFNLSRVQATALATRLVDSLDQNHQDTPDGSASIRLWGGVRADRGRRTRHHT
jgi:hypothetical protein